MLMNRIRNLTIGALAFMASARGMDLTTPPETNTPAERSYSWSTWLSDCWHGTDINVLHELKNKTFNGNAERISYALSQLTHKHDGHDIAEFVTECGDQHIEIASETLRGVHQILLQQRDQALALLGFTYVLSKKVNSLQNDVWVRNDLISKNPLKFISLRANKKARVAIENELDDDSGSDDGDVSDADDYQNDPTLLQKAILFAASKNVSIQDESKETRLQLEDAEQKE